MSQAPFVREKKTKGRNWLNTMMITIRLMAACRIS